jgi:hypothetical protein
LHFQAIEVKIFPSLPVDASTVVIFTGHFMSGEEGRITVTQLVRAKDRQLEIILARSHLPALDAIRAVSVFLVILSHSGGGEIGSLGVNAFFVLSKIPDHPPAAKRVRSVPGTLAAGISTSGAHCEYFRRFTSF